MKTEIYCVPSADFAEQIELKAEYIELAEKIRKTVKKSVKKKRYEHSLRVAETSYHMCEIYSCDLTKGFIAGLSHDMCKDLDDDEMIKTALRDGNKISDLELKKPSLLHGRAAAVKLREDFGIKDEEVLQAVAFHTLGSEKMCDLAKIVFSADKIEPGRPQSSKEYRTALFKKTLDGLCTAVLEEEFDYLKSKEKEASPQSLAFYNSLKK